MTKQKRLPYFDFLRGIAIIMVVGIHTFNVNTANIASIPLRTLICCAVALGAEVIEKHFIINRSIGGPDSAFSMEKDEFAAMVKSIRNVEKALGEVVYPTDPSKIKGREFCRSLYVAEDVKVGDVVTNKNVRSVRPGYGLHPKYLPEIQGKKFAKDCKKGTRFALDMVIG